MLERSNKKQQLYITLPLSMGVRRESKDTLDFENFSKNSLFSYFEWEKNFTTVAPPRKNPLVLPSGKILPTPKP